MGAGKTRVGKRIARLLGVDFVDTDRAVVLEHGPIPELFAAVGEAGFRALERAAVADAFARRAVVSLGGGAVLDERTQRELAELPVVLLTISEEAVAVRLGSDSRPLLTEGVASWRRIYAERRPLYERLARHTVDTSRRPIEHIAREIADWAKEQNA
ncbi:shikimate kinase [Galbitalea sp. SE-J8]|uniref:shikimate kinase n=1 Tax=Galbitalea sp. SE-J8 TaxID=3054952 RepID=UPI00259CD2F5|nr:shikimate kinase [Galbitalea sp. SE-J8]MDM4763254.1 shikimate kinase [Galbitalea sp. SE-J8]